MYLDEAAGKSDSLVGTVDDLTPEPDELAAAVGRAIEGRIDADWTGRTRTQHALVRRLLRLCQRRLSHKTNLSTFARCRY